MFAAGTLEEALSTLGEVLASRNQHVEILAIGGAALHLLGAITRPTKDIDVVAVVVDGALETSRPFPAALVQACADVARALDLSADWMNGGPTSLLQFGLPDGMLARTERRDFGGGLVVHVASRIDQIHFKLYAAVDGWPQKSKHIQDLRKLAPTLDELRAAARWTFTHDPSEGYRMLCRDLLEHLGAGGAIDEQ